VVSSIAVSRCLCTVRAALIQTLITNSGGQRNCYRMTVMHSLIFESVVFIEIVDGHALFYPVHSSADIPT
jgi:hypothetical protein